MSTKKPIDIDRRVGALVRALRISVGKSQSDLGNALGVTFQQVQKYENGTNRITVGRLNIIAELLGVDISYFFNSSSNKPAGGAINIIDRFIENVEAVSLVSDFLLVKNPLFRKQIMVLAKLFAEEGNDH